MRNRNIERLFCVLIAVTGLAGVLFCTGIPDGTGADFGRLRQFSSISIIFLVIYEMVEFFYLKEHGTGVFAAVVKFAAVSLFLYQRLIGLLLLGSFYAGAEGALRTGYLLEHILLPVLVLLEFVTEEKGHYYFRFAIPSLIIPIIYFVIALVCGASGMAFGVEGRIFPYTFIDVNVLGWGITVGTLVLLSAGYAVFCLVLALLDHFLYRRRRKNRR